MARQVFWAIDWSIGLVGKDSFVFPGPIVAWSRKLTEWFAWNIWFQDWTVYENVKSIIYMPVSCGL